jgi:hypothetical protein
MEWIVSISDLLNSTGALMVGVAALAGILKKKTLDKIVGRPRVLDANRGNHDSRIYWGSFSSSCSIPARCPSAAMAKDGAVISPERARRVGYDRDYRIFLAMHEHRRALDAIA